MIPWYVDLTHMDVSPTGAYLGLQSTIRIVSQASRSYGPQVQDQADCTTNGAERTDRVCIGHDGQHGPYLSQSKADLQPE